LVSVDRILEIKKKWLSNDVGDDSGVNIGIH
jgi:hypothetical protein